MVENCTVLLYHAVPTRERIISSRETSRSLEGEGAPTPRSIADGAARVHVHAHPTLPFKVRCACQHPAHARHATCCRRATAASPPSDRSRVPPFGCWSSAQSMTQHERALRRADVADAKTLSPWRGARSMLGVGETQPWLWGDMPRSGISRSHTPSPVAECGDENPAQHVGWTASTIQLSQDRTRCVPASLAI